MTTTEGGRDLGLPGGEGDPVRDQGAGEGGLVRGQEAGEGALVRDQEAVEAADDQYQEKRTYSQTDSTSAPCAFFPHGRITPESTLTRVLTSCEDDAREQNAVSFMTKAR